MDVSKALKDNNIKHSFLKGVVLNTLVYNAGDRISNDTDLRVKAKDIDHQLVLVKVGHMMFK